MSFIVAISNYQKRPKPEIYVYCQEDDLVEKADILKLHKLRQIYFLN